VTNKLARLKRELKRRRITQDQIALEAQCSRTYVNHYLNGRRGGVRVPDAIARMLAGAADHRMSA